LLTSLLGKGWQSLSDPVHSLISPFLQSLP
jgi:hypothetical protein